MTFRVPLRCCPPCRPCFANHQVRSGLLAALEALPPYALFGLVTFSHSVGLYDVRSKVPSVRYVPIKDGHAASSLPTTLSGGSWARCCLACHAATICWHDRGGRCCAHVHVWWCNLALAGGVGSGQARAPLGFNISCRLSVS